MRSYEDAVTAPGSLTLEDQCHQGYLVTFVWDCPGDYTAVYLKRLGDDSDWAFAPPFPIGDQLDAVMQELRGRDRGSYHAESSMSDWTVIDIYRGESGDELMGIFEEALRRTFENWKQTFAAPADVDALYEMFAGR